MFRPASAGSERRAEPRDHQHWLEVPINGTAQGGPVQAQHSRASNEQGGRTQKSASARGSRGQLDDRLQTSWANGLSRTRADCHGVWLTAIGSEARLLPGIHSLPTGKTPLHFTSLARCWAAALVETMSFDCAGRRDRCGGDFDGDRETLLKCRDAIHGDGWDWIQRRNLALARANLKKTGCRTCDPPAC